MQSQLTSKDFNDVIKYFQNQGIISKTISPSLLAKYKKLHALTYSLFLWRTQIKSSDKNKTVFIHEISSDAVQIVPLIAQGYRKPCSLVIRGIIENSLRHLYFRDHPIEFIKANQPEKWYLKMEELFSYCKDHPELKSVIKKFLLIDKLTSLYSELSVDVHGQKVSNMELKKSLKEISFNEKFLDEQIVVVGKCAEAVNFLLLNIHKEIVLGKQIEIQKALLYPVGAAGKKIWRGLN